jgi:transposase-like protein
VPVGRAAIEKWYRAEMEVLQLWRRDLIGWLDAPAHGFGFGSFQVAAIRIGVYLYRAVDSTGATIDFLLSVKRDAAAAESFLAKALGGENHPARRVINTDEHAGYPPAIARLKAEETLEENCRHRPVQYLNNVLEQDHRAIKRRLRASQHFRSFWGA